MISESGLIKIPQDLLKKTTDEAHLIFLSYAYHVTRLEDSLKKYHDMILKMLKFYDMSPIEKHMLNNAFSIKFDDYDLPKDYHNIQKDSKTSSVVVKIDPVEAKYYGYYQQPNDICLCTRVLYNVISDPKFSETALFEAFKKIDYTIEHELTHYIQHNYLHKDNTEMRPRYRDGGSDYYTSPVEFDPTIKSDLGTFAQHVYKLDRRGINEAIKYFVGAKYDTKYEFDFEKSPFFWYLRNSKIEGDKERYFKAVKTFAGLAREAVKDYLIEHTKVNEVEADRLDYVFGKLLLNEFVELVKNVNTFISYPESRQQDFVSIKKYLPKVDDRFKVNDTPKLIFVPCGKKTIEYITKAKKGFQIDVIFSNPYPEGTGMMFEFGDLPLFLNINILTRDKDYCDICDEYMIPRLEGNFVIADGKGTMFSAKNLVGVYENGKKVDG